LKVKEKKMSSWAKSKDLVKVSPKPIYNCHSRLDFKIQKRWFKLDPQSSWGWQI